MKPGCPRGWDSRPLSECGRWVSGGTPSTNNQLYWNGNIPWISAKSLRGFDIEDSEDRVTPAGASSGTKLVPAGSVLFVVRGMSLAKEFRVGVTCREVAFNQDLRGIIPCPDVDARFLARYLRHAQQSILGHADNAAHGTRRIPTDLLAAVPVSLPSLTEQTRIAAILDQADAIRRKRCRALTEVGELRLSMFYDLFGYPFAGRHGWKQARIDECGAVYGGITLGSRRNGYSLQLPYLRVANVYRDRLDLAEIKTVGVTESEAERTRLNPGDILVVEGHGNPNEIGRCAVWDGSICPCLHQNHLIRITPHRSQITPNYLSTFLNSPEGRRQLIRAGKTTSGLNTISLSNVRATVVELPPVPIQERYEQALQQSNRIGYTVQQACVAADALFDSLVQRAFFGEL